MDDLELTLVAARPQLQPSFEATARAREAALQAHVHRFGRRRSRRVVRLAVVLAVIALLAAPAYALVTHVIDFSHAAKAPTVIQKRFQTLSKSGAPPGMDPRVIAEETRLVTVFRVPSGSFPLWVAPTRTGGLCDEIGDLGGGCIADRTFTGVDPTPEGYKPWLVAATFSSVRDPRHGLTSYVSGLVLPKDASRLELTFGDHSVRPLSFIWVSRPIEAGFFLAELPDRGPYPVTISLFDAEGHLLSESGPLRPPEGPRSLS